MAVRIGKRDVAKMVAVLDSSYDSAEEAAQAVLEAAFSIYEDKAQYTVVGQLYYNGGFYDPGDPAADKVALGNYGTEKQAHEAARSLVFGSATNEQFRSWVLPVHHGTPNSWYVKRKKARDQPWLEEGEVA